MAGLHGFVGANTAAFPRLEMTFQRRCGDRFLRAIEGVFIGVDDSDIQCVLGTLEPGSFFAVDGQYESTSSFLKDISVVRGATHESKFLSKLMPSDVRGNLAHYCDETSILNLFADCSGMFPLYYVVNSGCLMFSSRQGLLASAAGAVIDRVGILEFLRYGYTVSDRSFFCDVMRLLPGQRIKYDSRTHCLELFETSDLWAGHSQSDDIEEMDDTGSMWDTLTRETIDAESDSGKIALMLSGGWDSRTLLAVLLDAHSPSEILGYMHGDSACREIKIAQRIADEHEVQSHLQGLESISLSQSDLAAYHHSSENVVFPHWHKAGEVLRGKGASIALAGIIGEVLGGHYGVSALYSGVPRVLAIARELGLPISDRVNEPLTGDRILARFYEGQLRRPWYIDQQHWASFLDCTSGINDDVRESLERYTKRGVPEDQRLVEAYVTEHRGAQYIAQQLLSIRSNVAISAPFATYDVLKASSLCAPSKKVHNSLNRILLKRFMPSLLRYPMAATLVEAGRPIFVQELSRVVRKVLEKSNYGLMKMGLAPSAGPHFGWANFEFLRMRQDFKDLPELLTGDFWDVERMRKQIQTQASPDIPVGSVHPYYDMMMKIVTVDFTLRDGNQ